MGVGSESNALLGQPGILAFSRDRVAEEREPIVIINAQADHALTVVRAASAVMQEVCAERDAGS